jgi:hypothetical protein
VIIRIDIFFNKIDHLRHESFGKKYFFIMLIALKANIISGNGLFVSNKDDFTKIGLF